MTSLPKFGLLTTTIPLRGLEGVTEIYYIEIFRIFIFIKVFRIFSVFQILPYLQYDVFSVFLSDLRVPRASSKNGPSRDSSRFSSDSSKHERLF